MSFFKISSLATIALLTVAGCAASTDEASEASQDELTARTDIELTSTRDPASVQAKLFKLMTAFKNDATLDISSAIETNSVQMSGMGEVGIRGRAITCSNSPMELVGPGGNGFSMIDQFSCTLIRFDKVRNGGQLPSVVVPFENNLTLAGKLFDLLEKGEKKGGLGVKQTASSNPGCCDRPTFTTYAISDADATLSCTMRGGGLTGLLHAECSFARNDAH